MDFAKNSIHSASANYFVRIKLRSPLALAAALLFAGISTPAHAQSDPVGVCVDPRGCGSSPSPPAPQPQEPAKLDPRMFWIGAAANVSGDVTFIYPNGQRVSGANAARAPIPLGARVVTGPGGHVQILLVDQTVFTLSGPGEMVMDRFVYDPDTNPVPTRISVKIVKGLFRFVTGKVAQRDPGSVQIGTPVGTIGIRGTDFEVFADPGGSGYVLLREGAIEFSSFDRGKTILMHAGQRLHWENFGDPVLE